MIKIRKKKLLLILIIITFIIILPIYIYVFKLPYFTIKEEERKYIENLIKTSPELPDRFYEIYDIIYPKSLKQEQLNYLIDRSFNNIKEQVECPCRLAAYNNQWVSRYRLSLPQMTFFIEGFASQKECLNYYASKFQFSKDIIGIKDVSIILYGKEINTLNDREYIELILIMENRHFYNKTRHHEIIEEKINKSMQSGKKR